MKKLVVLIQLFWFVVITGRAQEALERRIPLNIQNQNIQFVLDSIEAVASINFAYDRRKLPMQKIISITSTNETLASILDQLFGQSGVEYAASADQISLFRVRWPSYTMYGQIKDQGSGEALIGANVYETTKFQGASSNSDGYYSLTLAEGRYILYTSYIGFEDRVDTINLFDDLYLDLVLAPGRELMEVVVIDKIQKQEAIVALHRSNRGEEIIDVSHSKSLPTSLGESDPMGIVRLLPGFVAGGSGRQNNYVRGGNADQNLVLLDGVPLYHLNHGAGNFSIFNGTAINEVETYTNNIPARYGDRLSSVIDVKMREGNNQKFHGGAMIGLTSGSLHAEGPLVKGKASFLLAGRRSWSDILIGSITNATNGTATTNSFYDVNAKINYHVNKRDRIHASFYRGKDLRKSEIGDSFTVLLDRGNQRTQWGNTAAAVRWNRKFNPRLFSNFSLQLTNFRHRNKDENFVRRNREHQLQTELQYSSLVRESRMLADAVYIPSVKHRVNFGGQFTWRITDPGSITNIEYNPSDTIYQEDTIDKIRAREGVIFVEEEFKLNDHWTFRGGLRLTYLSVQNKNYIHPNIRANIGYAINSKHRLELSFDQNIQFMHLLSIAGSPVQNEKWLPTTERVRPELANQLSLNYIATSDRLKLKIGTYYKQMEHLLYFNQATSAFDSYSNWEEQITSGSGEAYGLEFLLAKLNGKTNGWLSYTWSKSMFHFPLLNNSERFPHRYDRRHKVNIAITHSIKAKPSKQRYFGIVWTFATGHWTTLPSESVVDPIDGSRTPIYNEVNNVRLQDYHQLSISFNKDRKTSNGNLATWRYGIQNVYLKNIEDQPNTYYNNQTEQYELRENETSGIPIPFIAFSYTF